MLLALAGEGLVEALQESSGVLGRATQAWADRYRADEWLRRRIDRAVVRLVVERHARACLGQRALTGALAAGA